MKIKVKFIVDDLDTRLEMKKGKPCSHSFKCFNYKGTHTTNSVKRLFWKHCFNKEWHTKEYAHLWEARRESIHSNSSKARK